MIAGFMALVFVNTVLGIYKGGLGIQIILGAAFIALLTASVWIKPPEQNKP
jgi:hypothetical protein